jgi:hypothetical protein
LFAHQKKATNVAEILFTSSAKFQQPKRSEMCANSNTKPSFYSAVLLGVTHRVSAKKRKRFIHSAALSSP